MPDVTLAAVTDEDVLVFHGRLQDETARRMAAFVGADRSLEAHVEHWRRMRASAAVTARSVVVAGETVGHVASFDVDGEREVTCWIEREHWGCGIATGALRAFLDEAPQRPLRARTVTDNAASRRVLEACGFVVVGDDRGFAEARGEVVDEWVLPARGESHSARDGAAHAVRFVPGSRRIHRFACAPGPRSRRDRHRPARKHFQHGLLRVE